MADEVNPPKKIKDILIEKDDRINSSDLKFLCSQIVQEQGLITHHIEDYNNFGEDVKIIVSEQFRIDMPPFQNLLTTTDENKSISMIAFNVRFSNIKLIRPTTSDILSKRPVPLFPAECRNRLLSYTSSMFLDINADFTAYDNNGKILKTKKESVTNFDLTTVPIMVRSKNCNTYNIRNNATALREVKEAPEDLGGYFIMNGVEYYIMNSENIKFNSPYVYLAPNIVSKERAWLELISKPGDHFENSHQIIVRLGKKNEITIEIKSLVPGVQIPFYIIFRMLGMTDEETVNSILLSDARDDPVIKQIQYMLELAYTAKIDEKVASLQWNYNRAEIMLFIGELVRDLEPTGEHRKSPEAVQKLVSDVIFKLDRLFLPHIGEDSSSQITKARYLGYLIQRLLMVDLKIIEPSDRDAYTNKRIHAAGATLAKGFKSQFNLAVVQKIKYELKNQFKATSFSNVKLQTVLNMVNKKSLEKALAQLITSSDDVINMGPSITVQNRVSSQAVHRKNQLNVIVSARNIETPTVAAKQTDRAFEMRHVQSTHDGYICPMASKDTGEKVGMTKELAITCIITPSLPGATGMLREMLLSDELVIKLSDVLSADIAARKLAKVFINGNWIGVVEAPHLLCSSYRDKRRSNLISIYITIFWNDLLDEVHFQTDQGRLLRPLIGMDNNFYEIVDAECQKKSKIPDFVQRPRLTRADIDAVRSGKTSCMSLIEHGMMDYISTEEQLNCFIAQDIDNIIDDITKPFTHVEIPQAVYGVSAHAGILLNHNAPTRSTYETNQVKQTNGLYCLGWPWRLDKNSSLQVDCGHPLVRTIINDFTNPIGNNAVCGYLPWDGNMQEDSVLLNKAHIDMGMFYVAYLNYYMTTLETGEIIRLPGEDTMDIRSKASYSKLTSEGFLKPGTILGPGDVIIPKLMTISTSAGSTRAGGGDKFRFIDRSIIHKSDEISRVEQLTRESITTSSDGKKFVYVKTVSELPVAVGDKFSTRAGNKSIVAGILPSIDMPITASGTVIDYLINPQTITSRMVVAQIIEGVLSKLCAQKGIFMDASAYTKLPMTEIRAELARFGIQNVCLEQVYCGRTGMSVDALIAVCPSYLQRLQKYAIKEGYSVQHGPKDELTGQPVSGGRASGGGARHGEMEIGCLAGHGSMGILKEIMFDNSDGCKIYICRKCGQRADVNIATQVFKCKTCGPLADIVYIDSGKASNLFLNYINAMSIGTTINVK